MLCIFVISMVTLRSNLSPNVAVPLNMTLCLMCVITVFKFKLSFMHWVLCIGLLNLTIVHKLFLCHIALLVIFILGLALGLILATVTSIKM